MHNLPRLNGCGVSNERQYCFLSADAIFFTFNEPVVPQYVFYLSLVIWRLCWHGRARIHPDIDVSKNAICTICRGWMAAGYQMKGNIVFYLLMKYVSLLTSRFSTICLQLKSSHLEVVLTWLFKNTSWYRCFQVRHMHNLPRLNSCGVSNERQYCLLSADEICFTFNEPFFHNMSLTEILSFGGCVDMVVQECILISKFQERHMHNLPRLNGCGVSNERQYCCLSDYEICFTFNEPFFGNMSLTEVLSIGGCVNMFVQEYILISMFPSTPYAQSAAAEWLRGIKWKAILFSICWWNMFHV